MISYNHIYIYIYIYENRLVFVYVTNVMYVDFRNIKKKVAQNRGKYLRRGRAKTTK